VQVDHLRSLDGGEVSLRYTVEMISLYVQDAVNVEISKLEAALHPGETLGLSAQVIPAYADDLSVSWSSTDPAVARVDEGGRVTAVAPGECEILCRDCLGHTDACALTVAG
jgi:uncharacterized protein YjdB